MDQEQEQDEPDTGLSEIDKLLDQIVALAIGHVATSSQVIPRVDDIRAQVRRLQEELRQTAAERDEHRPLSQDSIHSSPRHRLSKPPSSASNHRGILPHPLIALSWRFSAAIRKSGPLNPSDHDIDVSRMMWYRALQSRKQAKFSTSRETSSLAPKVQ